MPHFDWTISVSNLIVVGGLIYTFFKVIIGQRDFNREVLRTLGKARPPGEREGLLGDVETLKEDRNGIEDYLTRYASFDRRGPLTDRRRDT